MKNKVEFINKSKKSKCWSCNGIGKIDGKKCFTCKGTKKFKETFYYLIYIDKQGHRLAFGVDTLQ